MSEIMSGNEAVARGIYEGGCSVAAAYPGTPSTEILRMLSGIRKISTASGPAMKRSQWKSHSVPPSAAYVPSLR